MRGFKIIAVVFFVGILAIEAATVEKKHTTTNNNNVKKNKDIKEKRDAAQTQSVPYSYETPQKSFQIPAQSQYQQKVAAIEYQQPRQEQHQQAQQAQQVPQVQHVQHVQHIQPQQYQKVQPQIQQQYHQIQESAPQQHSFSSYPSAGLESYFSQPMKSAGFGDFGYDFPGFENFEHVQGLNYNQNMQNINNAYAGGQYGIPSKSPIYSIKQQVEFPSFNYADLHSAGLAQSAPSYSFPMQTYAISQQQLHDSIPSYFQSYAPQAQSYAPHAQSYAPQASHSYAPIELGYGFNQAALYTPQALAISASKPTKTPDYAHGVKGLGHFSTVSALSAAASPTSSYSKPSYQPQYQYIQQATEKPFRASAFLGSSQSHDSLTEQSIASIKPANDYLPPSKQYLPAKEQQLAQLHQQQAQQHQQQAQQHQQQTQQHHQQPQQHHQQHHQQPQHQQHQYQIQHIPSSEHVQVQYIQQQPSKQYIAPSQNSFSSKPFAQAPKNNYLPPQNNYLPPKSSYLPPKPSNTYLPANHQFTSNTNSHPSLSAHHQQQQQYAQPQQYTQSHEDSYELDYQSSAPAHQQQSAGHK